MHKLVSTFWETRSTLRIYLVAKGQRSLQRHAAICLQYRQVLLFDAYINGKKLLISLWGGGLTILSNMKAGKFWGAFQIDRCIYNFIYLSNSLCLLCLMSEAFTNLKIVFRFQSLQSTIFYSNFQDKLINYIFILWAMIYHWRNSILELVDRYLIISRHSSHSSHALIT